VVTNKKMAMQIHHSHLNIALDISHILIPMHKCTVAGKLYSYIHIDKHDCAKYKISFSVSCG